MQLCDTKSSIQRLVLNQIDNLPVDELRIDRAKMWKVSSRTKYLCGCVYL